MTVLSPAHASHESVKYVNNKMIKAVRNIPPGHRRPCINIDDVYKRCSIAAAWFESNCWIRGRWCRLVGDLLFIDISIELFNVVEDWEIEGTDNDDEDEMVVVKDCWSFVKILFENCGIFVSVVDVVVAINVVWDGVGLA